MGAKKYIPDTIRKKIIIMAADGKTIAEIMRATGQTDKTISKVCKDAGMKANIKREKPTEEKRNAVLDLYSRGYTVTEITCETLIPSTAVRNYISEAKIITFPNVDKHPAEEYEQPVQLTMDVAESTTDKRREALLMIREAINILIEVENNDSETK